MLKALADLQHDKYGVKTIFHALMGIAIFFIRASFGALPIDVIIAFTNMDGSLATIIAANILRIAVPFALVYLYVVKILRLPISNFRMQKARNITVWIVRSILPPIVVSCFYIFVMPGVFSVSDYNQERILRAVINAVFRTCLAVGITEELIFRGFIMRLLEIRWNKYVAVVIPSILFALLHIFNVKSTNLGDVFLLLVAGTGSGVMFSMVAMQSGSIWASAFIHGIWNLIIVGSILTISIEPSPSIFAYTLHPGSVLLTGGAYGIEFSLPALIYYFIIIIIACLLLQKKNREKATLP